MRRTTTAFAGLLALLLNACSPAVQVERPQSGSATDATVEIIALERAALDRWGRGDPQGYLDTYAPDITYFDPTSERRLDGLEAMKAYYAPLTGLVRVPHYDMIAPKVQQYGDAAVLTFQLTSYGTKLDGGEIVSARWNSTAVYRRAADGWKSAHSHWSYIKPELKVKPLE